MFIQKIFTAAAFVLLSYAHVSAQQTSIKFIVKDQGTGFAIPGATIKATAPGGKTTQLSVAKNGQYIFPAGAGRYTFTVTAKGYKALETFFVTGAETTIEANVNLDPVTTETTQLRARENQLSISGYIKDNDKNIPLAGVQVNVGASSATSDSKGFFSIELPSPVAPLTEGSVPDKISIRVTKAGYVSHTIQNFYAIADAHVLKIALSPATSLQRGGEEIEVQKHGMFDRTAADDNARVADAAPLAVLAVAVPSSIRVGTSCNCTSCSVVQVMSLEAYTQSGLDDEWIASWGDASLQAGAVAYRTYGAWYVLHPVASSYDIAATTCNQAWQSDISTKTKNAAIATAGTVLLKSGAIFRSEYSAENNNSGCGNGYSGTGTANGWPCISDSRCSGRAKNGHGRGMCQWGSSFWASDKTYMWILDHYYTPGGVIVQLPTAPPATILSFTMKDQVTGTALASTTATITKPNGTTITATSNASGKLAFNADTGKYVFSFAKSGYTTLKTSFTGGPNDSITADINLDPTAAAIVANSIRVITSCACTGVCSTVQLQVMSLEAYVQSGLDDEWVSSWNAASLQAGSVAYRSRGAWYIQHPVTVNYDLSSAACHQTWQNDRAASVKTAAIATKGIVLVKNGEVVRADYAAENNNAGCGDGFSGNSTTWPCIADARCIGRANSGNGKGMCQWGSSFWGTDQTYTWILNHYYNPDSITIQLPVTAMLRTTKAETVAADNNLQVSPNPVRGSEIRINYNNKGIAQTATLMLFDNTGQPVRQQKVALQTGYNRLNLNTGKIRSGIYIIRLQANGKAESKKVVVIE